MTDNEMLTLGVSGVSLLVSMVALLRSSKERSTPNGEDGSRLLLAQLELDLTNNIREAKQRSEDFLTANGDLLTRAETTLSDDEKEKRKRAIVLAIARVEGYLRALDDACQKYVDGKVDKQRFKRAHQRDVREAVQSEEHEELFRVGHVYRALMDVYEEWESPEKRRRSPPRDEN